MCYVNPRPVPEDIIKIYPDSYIEGYTSDELDSLYKRTLLKRLRLVKDIVKSGRLLEVGCAGGYFLNLARQEGYEVMGVEIDERSAKFAQKTYGLSVQISSIEDANLTESYFDIVVMFDVFEHTLNPNLALQKIKGSLRQGGYLLIKVPNFACIESKLFKGIWYGHDLPRDILHFSPLTLNLILTRNGYKNISIIHFGEPNYAITSFIRVVKMLKNKKFYEKINSQTTINKYGPKVKLNNLIFRYLCYLNAPLANFLAFLHQGNSIVGIAQK
jgi:2-polyprenyl-3-methyl-5-hydroxy-6-metoxy-1,4-benzoquinol methylase